MFFAVTQPYRPCRASVRNCTRAPGLAARAGLARDVSLGSLRRLRYRIYFGFFGFEDRHFIWPTIQQRLKKTRLTPLGREKRTVRPRSTTPLKTPPWWNRLINHVKEARELGLGIFRFVIINDKIPRKPRPENDAIHHIAFTAHKVQVI